MKSLVQSLQALLIQCLLLLVRSYQLFLSPLLQSSCRFYPSCSQYCQQALQEHGLIQGLLLSGKRICRCRPGVPCGLDPVPKKHT